MINYMKIWNRSRIHQGRVVGYGEEIQSPARKASLGGNRHFHWKRVAICHPHLFATNASNGHHQNPLNVLGPST
jgi:hypothetical protein